MPFGDLTGGDSGFNSDADGATANLDISMSEESARNLWDVQAAVQQIAADFQTAVRAAADFNSYLISVRETSQTIRMPSMGNMEAGESGNMSYSGGRVDSSSVPFVQGSEQNMISRIGEMEENSSGAGGGAMAARNPAAQPIDPGGFVNSITQAAFLTSAFGSQRGEVHPQAFDMHGNPFDPNMVGARYSGQPGGVPSQGFRGSQLVAQGIPAAQQFLRGGGVGGVAGMLGRVGTYGAIAYAGYQIADAGLQTYAQSRAMAISANNSQYGAGWGFQQRVGQAEMAMMPFVSQEEAAQIYGTAIDQGWASRRGGYAQGDFNSAVNFMYGNAKDYNMDPAMSAQLLQTNVLGAGESVEALSQQLLTLKQTLDGTGVSTDAANKSFTSFSSFLIGQGASPGDAALIAGGAIRSSSVDTYWSNGRLVEMAQAGMSSPTIQAMVGATTGHLPGAAFAGANAIPGTKAYEKLIHQLAMQYSGMTGISPEDRVAYFMQAYSQLTGQQTDYLGAEKLMNLAASNENFISEGQEDFKKKGSIGGLEHQNWAQASIGGMDWDLGIAGTDLIGGHWLNKLGVPGMKGRTHKDFQNDPGSLNAHQYYNKEVNLLLQNAGKQLGKYVLYDSSGNPVRTDGHDVAGADIASWFSHPENFAKFKDPNSGMYIKGPDDNTYNAQNIGLGGSKGGIDPAATDANTIFIKMDPEFKGILKADKDRLQLTKGYFGNN